MLKLFASSATHAGRIRASNEDRALVADDLVAVADGMGGHVGGEIAAEMAVERFASDYNLATGLEGLIAAARRANRAVYQRSEAEPTLRGMGTTLTAAALVRENGQEVLHVINIGDSRAYFLEGNRVIQISEDHSLAEEMVRHGELTPEMALVHPHRHIITRAVGIEPEVGVDAFSFEAHAGMRLLVASDGLTNEVNDQEIAAILSIHLNREEAAATLLQTALAHGGSDNITVIVADVLDEAANDAVNLDLATSGGAAAVPLAESVLPTVTPFGEAVLPPGSPFPDEAGSRAPSRRVARAATTTGTPRRARAVAPRGARTTPHRRGERIVTVRAALFVVALVSVLGGIAGFTLWFNRGTYFVGISDGHVTIFEGRPGGFLWFKPTVIRETSLPISGVLDANVSLLRAGVLESSYGAAEHVVNNLTNEHGVLGLPTSTTSTTIVITKPRATVPVTTTAKSG
ncbi:MAG TPA: PP2C family serine/threonine-protein phosphatase [Acidimicrobiales bacterium]